MLIGIVWELWRWWSRGRLLRRWAVAVGFHYLGGALPHWFPIGPTVARGHVSHVLLGEMRGRQVVCFDYSQSWGDTRRVMTAVAVQGFSPGESYRYGPDAVVEEFAGWGVIHRPGRLSPREIECLLAEAVA